MTSDKVPLRATADGAKAEAGQQKSQPVAQRSMDRLVRIAFLWAIPTWVRPNHLTIARLVLIPVILVLLHLEYHWWALGTFVLATCTDFIDGTMARTRDQITIFGTYMDPVADKLLVAVVLAWVGYKYLVVQIILAFIVLELVITAVGASILLRTNEARSSNVFGKIKMILQSVALLLFLVAGILELPTWTTISCYLLWLALALAVLSGGKQIYDLIKRKPRQAPPPVEPRSS
jgi:CDP-diacylglycerol--glycerol-3-phosphate 3-phosphatidyltransferase